MRSHLRAVAERSLARNGEVRVACRAWTDASALRFTKQMNRPKPGRSAPFNERDDANNFGVTRKSLAICEF
jgi:hypothetical protein